MPWRAGVYVGVTRSPYSRLVNRQFFSDYKSTFFLMERLTSKVLHRTLFVLIVKGFT